MTNLVKKVKIIMYFYALKGYFLLYFKCMKIQNIFKKGRRNIRWIVVRAAEVFPEGVLPSVQISVPKEFEVEICTVGKHFLVLLPYLNETA